jgi:hypothetical protein
MTMGDKAAHKNEKYKFLVGSRQNDVLLINLIWFDFWCLTPLSANFQLFHGDQF